MGQGLCTIQSIAMKWWHALTGTRRLERGGASWFQPLRRRRCTIRCNAYNNNWLLKKASSESVATPTMQMLKIIIFAIQWRGVGTRELLNGSSAGPRGCRGGGSAMITLSVRKNNLLGMRKDAHIIHSTCIEIFFKSIKTGGGQFWITCDLEDGGNRIPTVHSCDLANHWELLEWLCTHLCKNAW